MNCYKHFTIKERECLQQFFITSYTVDDGKFVAGLLTTTHNCQFDGNNTITFDTLTLVRTGAQASEKVTLPEGMAGKYYDEKNQENYFEISDDGVTAHIDGEDKTYKLAKAEGNTVTLDGEQVLTYNAEEHSITWDGNKYIDWDHYEFKLPFDLPENFFGRYSLSGESGVYIEIRKDGTVTWKRSGYGIEGEYKIDNFDGTYLTMTKIDGTYKDTVLSWVKDASGKMTLTYQGTPYVKAAA